MRHEQFDSLIMSQQEIISYICDVETYDILHLTPHGMKIYGLTSPEAYRGKKCYELLQGREAPCPFCTNCALVEGEKYCWEHYNEKLQRWMSAEDTLVRIDGRLCRLEIAWDITAQKQNLSALSTQLSTEETLVACIRTLAQEPDRAVAIQRFLEMVGTFYTAGRAYIFELDGDRHLFHNTYDWCAPGGARAMAPLPDLPLGDLSQWVRGWEQRGDCYIQSLSGDLTPDSGEYRLLAARGIQSLMAAPLRRGGNTVGFIGVDDPGKNSGDPTLLRSTADFVLAELEKRQLVQDLEYASYTDMLTGLKNRNQYIKTLQQWDETPPRTMGVLFVDINGMKGINDNYGHNYGDYVIAQVANLLKLHAEDMIFRIGGDEFVVLKENIDRETFQALALSLRRAFALDPDCDVSMGDVWRDGVFRVEDAVLCADKLMYANKQSYYQSMLQHGRPPRGGIASQVLQEIQEHRFAVLFQPKVNLKDGEIIGAEALVQKKRQDGGMLSPEQFLPLYESEGVVRHLDCHVLEVVCAALQEWQKAGLYLPVSLNVSYLTLLEPGIAQTIRGICGQYHVNPAYITLELAGFTGTLDRRQLQAQIQEITRFGFSISLDHFGSQQSNLAMLTILDFQEVKFDRSLVADLEENAKSRIVLQNSLRMFQELDTGHTLAEGIETQGQLDLLARYSCGRGQGFYISKPLPPNEFLSFFRQHAAQSRG